MLKRFLQILQSEETFMLFRFMRSALFLPDPRGEEKKMQNKQTEQKQSFSFVFGHPKAYKGTPRGEVCL